MSERWVIEFDYPEFADPAYAGMYKGALGWAAFVDTAIVFDDKEAAERTLKNGYGKQAQYGRVIAYEKGKAAPEETA